MGFIRGDRWQIVALYIGNIMVLWAVIIISRKIKKSSIFVLLAPLPHDDSGATMNAYYFLRVGINPTTRRFGIDLPLS